VCVILDTLPVPVFTAVLPGDIQLCAVI